MNKNTTERSRRTGSANRQKKTEPDPNKDTQIPGLKKQMRKPKPSEKESLECVACEKVFTDEGDKLITCERSHKWNCIECAKMTDEVYTLLNSAAASTIHWFSVACEKQALTAVQTYMNIEERCASYMNKMTGRIEDIEEKLDTKADTTATEALSAEVQSIREKNEQTKEEATQMVAKINKLKTKGEEMIKEEKERERRKNNFMVFHMPEPTDGDINEKKTGGHRAAHRNGKNLSK